MQLPTNGRLRRKLDKPLPGRLLLLRLVCLLVLALTDCFFKRLQVGSHISNALIFFKGIDIIDYGQIEIIQIAMNYIPETFDMIWF